MNHMVFLATVSANHEPKPNETMSLLVLLKMWGGGVGEGWYIHCALYSDGSTRSNSS